MAEKGKEIGASHGSDSRNMKWLVTLCCQSESRKLGPEFRMAITH